MTISKELETIEKLEHKIEVLESMIDRLNKRDHILTALENAGVDNWMGYGEALEEIPDEDLV